MTTEIVFWVQPKNGKRRFNARDENRKQEKLFSLFQFDANFSTMKDCVGKNAQLGISICNMMYFCNNWCGCFSENGT